MVGSEVQDKVSQTSDLKLTMSHAHLIFLSLSSPLEFQTLTQIKGPACPVLRFQKFGFGEG